MKKFNDIISYAIGKSDKESQGNEYEFIINSNFFNRSSLALNSSQRSNYLRLSVKINERLSLPMKKMKDSMTVNSKNLQDEQQKTLPNKPVNSRIEKVK